MSRRISRKTPCVIAAILVICMVATSLAFVFVNNFSKASAGSEKEVTVGGIVYAVCESSTNPYATVKSASELHSYVGTLTIHASLSYNYKTYPITKISDEAFLGCANVTKFVLPDTITSIGNKAFFSCFSLEEINIPSSLVSIGENAFYGCYNLSILNGLSTSSNLKSISKSAFESCTSLASVVFPNSLTTIGEKAFYECTLLTNVEFPKTVSSVGNEAFAECSSLSSVVIPNGVKFDTSAPTANSHIFAGCFEGCIIYIGAQSYALVTQNNVYKYFSKIIDLVEDNNKPNSSLPVASELSVIVYNKSGGNVTLLKSSKNISGCVVIPRTIESFPVTEIAERTFEDCISLNGITLPSSIEIINSLSFKNCSSLRYVAGASDLKIIYGNSFDGCVALKYFDLPASIITFQGAENSKLFKDCSDELIVYVHKGEDEVDYYKYISSDVSIKRLAFAADIQFKEDYSRISKDGLPTLVKDYAIIETPTRNEQGLLELFSFDLEKDFNIQNGGIPFVWTFSNDNLFEIKEDYSFKASTFPTCKVFMKDKNYGGSSLITATSIDGKYVFKYIVNIFITPTFFTYEQNVSFDSSTNYIFFNSSLAANLSYSRSDGLIVNDTMTWKSENEYVAKINKKNSFFNVMEPGKTTITGTFDHLNTEKISTNIVVYGLNFSTNLLKIKDDYLISYSEKERTTIVIDAYLPDEFVNFITVDDLVLTSSDPDSISAKVVGKTVLSKNTVRFELRVSPTKDKLGNFYVLAKLSDKYADYSTTEKCNIDVSKLNFSISDSGIVMNRFIAFWRTFIVSLVDLFEMIFKSVDVPVQS